MPDAAQGGLERASGDRLGWPGAANHGANERPRTGHHGHLGPAGHRDTARHNSPTPGLAARQTHRQRRDAATQAVEAMPDSAAIDWNDSSEWATGGITNRGVGTSSFHSTLSLGEISIFPNST
jgi:hypothetical protein